MLINSRSIFSFGPKKHSVSWFPVYFRKLKSIEKSNTKVKKEIEAKGLVERYTEELGGFTLSGLPKEVVCAQSCPALCDPTACSPPGSSVHEILWAKTHWSGLPFVSPGDFPDPRIKPGSPALRADSLPSESPGKPHKAHLTYM